MTGHCLLTKLHPKAPHPCPSLSIRFAFTLRNLSPCCSSHRLRRQNMLDSMPIPRDYSSSRKSHLLAWGDTDLRHQKQSKTEGFRL
jgi:hypothetical protein